MLQTKTTCDKPEKTYAALVAVETTTRQHKVRKQDENMKTHLINKSLGKIQGIPDNPNKTKGENLVQTIDEINGLLNTKSANAHVTKIQRLRKFRYDSKIQEWF